MQYVFDNSHSSGGEEFQKAVEQAIQQISDGTLYIEDFNASPHEKETKERLFNEYIQGEAELKGNELTDSEYTATIGGTTKIVLQTAREYHDKIDSIDSGPVYDSDVEEEAQIIEQLQKRGANDETNTDRISSFIAEHVSKRDLEYLHYLGEHDSDPDNTVIVRGSTHPTDEELSERYEIDPVNNPNIESPINESARNKALELFHDIMGESE